MICDTSTCIYCLLVLFSCIWIACCVFPVGFVFGFAGGCCSYVTGSFDLVCDLVVVLDGLFVACLFCLLGGYISCVLCWVALIDGCFPVLLVWGMLLFEFVGLGFVDV